MKNLIVFEEWAQLRLLEMILELILLRGFSAKSSAEIAKRIQEKENFLGNAGMGVFYSEIVLKLNAVTGF